MLILSWSLSTKFRYQITNNLSFGGLSGSPSFKEDAVDQKFVDAITNVRLVSGTIRIDLMNITGQTDDNKLQFAKTGELILSQQAFRAGTEHYARG